MDLRTQLHDALWVRVLFTIALLTGVLWVQMDHHGVVASELLLGVGVVALVNLPMYIVERRLPTRTTVATIVVSDLVLVTAGVIFAGGTLSAEGIFYVWPIVFSAVFLRRVGAVRRGGSASVAYVAVWELQHVGWLEVSALVAEIQVPPNWMLITVCLHVAAFMLVALLSGRLAHALIGSSAQLSRAKVDTDEQLRRMQATNEQLRVMSESSRVFLRYQDVAGLIPDALAQIAGATGVAPASRSSSTTTAATSRSGRSPAASAPMPPGATRSSASSTSPAPARSATRRSRTRRWDACSRPWRRTATADSSPRLWRPSTSFSVWCACCAVPTRSSPRRPCPRSARCATRWPWSCATSSTTRNWRARTRSSRTSTR